MRHVGEYSTAKTGEYPRIFLNFQNCARCVKDLKDNKDNSLHLGRKYARILVLGHYLFLVAHSFPRATLSENCELRGTDNVRGQMSKHIFAPNGGYCLFINGLNLAYLRAFRYIKLSSPRMNNVIVVGAILIYIAGILLGIDGNFVSSDVEAILRCRVSSFRIEPVILIVSFVYANSLAKLFSYVSTFK